MTRVLACLLVVSGGLVRNIELPSEMTTKPHGSNNESTSLIVRDGKQIQFKSTMIWIHSPIVFTYIRNEAPMTAKISIDLCFDENQFGLS
jgi:hypothetical protein